MNNIGVFYQSAIGRMAHDFLFSQLQKILGKLQPEERVLIIGFGVPFADDVVQLGTSKITLAYFENMPPVPWPDPAAHQSCVISPDALPFGDVTFDRVIVFHSLEFAPDPLHLLLEVQRILTAQGQVIIIAPKRGGLWSWFEHTPFGEGRTFSSRQIRRLLTAAQLAPLHIRSALFTPPLDFSFHALAAGFARALEGFGSYLNLRIGGVVIASAQKQRYAGIPVKTNEYVRRQRMQWATSHTSTRQKGSNV